MSRLNLASEAVRTAMKGRLLFAGPPGSGKTRTALAVATVLAEGAPFLGIDTERETMLTYAKSPTNPTGFEFRHLPWREPFDIVELADTINEAGHEFPVIMIDSMTHFWKEPGGVLDMVEGRFGGWKGVRPLQAKLMAAILDSPAHVVMCVRSKIAYAQEVDERTKKQVVKKLGLEIEFDRSLESEVQVFVEMDMTHTMSISKSRSEDVPVGRVYAAHDERNFATQYAEWLRAGDPFAPLEEQARIDTTMRALDEDQKRVLWDLWKRHALPKPENMTATHVAIADKLIAQVSAGPATRVAQQATSAAERLRAAAGAETAPADAPAAAQPAEPPASDEGEEKRQKQRDSALRRSLLGEAEKRFGDGWLEEIKAATGLDVDYVSNDELRSLVFREVVSA